MFLYQCCASIAVVWKPSYFLICHQTVNDVIGLNEVFKIQDVLHYKINGYHNLLFNTRLDTDDGHGEVGLYISDTFTYSKQEYLSLMYLSQYFLIKNYKT